MRKTVTLTLGPDLADFIDQQPGMVDPSAFMARLFHEEMKRQGFQFNPNANPGDHDEVLHELERMTERDIPAAG